MQVKLYASLRQAAGTKMLEDEVNTSTTMRILLEEDNRRIPILEKLIRNQQGELSEKANSILNGENIRHLAGLDTIPKPEDHVDIFPPLVGG